MNAQGLQLLSEHRRVCRPANDHCEVNLRVQGLAQSQHMRLRTTGFALGDDQQDARWCVQRGVRRLIAQGALPW